MGQDQEETLSSILLDNNFICGPGAGALAPGDFVEMPILGSHPALLRGGAQQPVLCYALQRTWILATARNPWFWNKRFCQFSR